MRVRSGLRLLRRARFNGASSSRTRMRRLSGSAAQRSASLQWGLVLADEDAWVLGTRSGSGHAASMGPRPRGRGCGSRRADRAGRPAALQWGLVLADEDANVVNLGAFTLSSLQWGLVLADEDA